MTPQVGIFPPVFDRDPGELRRFLARAADAGLDHVAVGDHVSFWVGAGRDGLVDATAMAMLHPALPVHVAVHLLAMRQGGSSRALSMQRETLRAVTFGPELYRGPTFTRMARLGGVRRELVWPTTSGTPGFRRGER